MDPSGGILRIHRTISPWFPLTIRKCRMLSTRLVSRFLLPPFDGSFCLRPLSHSISHPSPYRLTRIHNLPTPNPPIKPPQHTVSSPHRSSPFPPLSSPSSRPRQPRRRQSRLVFWRPRRSGGTGWGRLRIEGPTRSGSGSDQRDRDENRREKVKSVVSTSSSLDQTTSLGK
jgi:hypothetical protein